ncbi:Cupin-2 domain-containing protein [Mycena venus]|uniref:Cupin-2 domain-containing protein n=1 Tax=Mycena venus TaxID=2733690 RepID=A0A8H6XGV5_9AGAR|nr:Cupin-2 domain-containing protein [Mycena venus]
MPGSQSQTPFKPVRRVVTGHTPSGKSTVVADTVQPPTFWSPKSISPIYDLCHTSEAPAVIDSEITKGEWVDEIAQNKEHVSNEGSVFRVFEFAPGTVSPAHRTVSLDYGIVAKGSMVLELDDGEKITLNEGDTIVQRGTMHTWRNESTEWARIYFVVLGAKPIEINGEKLEQEWRK